MGLLRHCRIDELHRRLLAAGCILLVFGLGMFAASPVLHDHLHSGKAPSADQGCTVVQFANGVSVTVISIDVAPVPVEWWEQKYFDSAELHLESPRYLLQPVCGPPVA